MSERKVYGKGKIHDVIVKPVAKFLDERGWLAELFRQDEVALDLMPVMTYISMTQPDVARGPHEHVDQTDYFCFIGPANFKVYLWDSRPESPSFGVKQVIYAGIDSPMTVIVPPGVVHAYKNISQECGIVFNGPNRLYAGEGKKQPVDEIRHEEADDSPFVLD